MTGTQYERNFKYNFYLFVVAVVVCFGFAVPLAHATTISISAHGGGGYGISTSVGTSTDFNDTVEINNTTGASIFHFCYWKPDGTFGGDLGTMNSFISYPLWKTDSFQNLFGFANGTYWFMLNYAGAYGPCSGFGNQAYAAANNDHYGSAYFGLDAVVGPALDTTHTQFYSFTPAIGTSTPTATSTTFAIGTTGYLEPGDLTDTTQINFTVGTDPFFGGPPMPYRSGAFPLYASGAFATSTTISLTQVGDYPVRWWITNCTFQLFGICFNTNVLVSLSGDILVGNGIGGGYGQVATSTAQDIKTFVYGTSVFGGTTLATSSLDASSGTSTVFSSSYGLVSVITNKFPFNWVVGYASVLSNLGASTGQLGSTTVDTSHVITYSGVPSVTMDFSSLKELQKIPTTTAQTLTVTLFSASTLNSVAAIPGIQTMRLFISWFLWIELLIYAWGAATTQIFQGPVAKS